MISINSGDEPSRLKTSIKVFEIKELAILVSESDILIETPNLQN